MTPLVFFDYTGSAMSFIPANTKRESSTFTTQSGQALLIVLLSMAVVLTIVLSIISFSVTDISVTTRESDALRAFSAAEAGVEKALVALSSQTGNFNSGQDSYSANVSNIAEGTQNFNFPSGLSGGETGGVWFVAHDTNGNLTCSASKPCFTGSRMDVCWGKSGTPAGAATTPAIEVSVYYSNPPASSGNFSGVSVARDTADPNSSRRGSNAFSAPDSTSGCTIDGVSYQFRKTIDFAALGIPAVSYNAQNGLQMAHVKLFYNSEPQSLGFTTAGVAGLLPSQGQKINSIGTAGESTRAVEVYKMYADIAGVFESALFTSAGVSK